MPQLYFIFQIQLLDVLQWGITLIHRPFDKYWHRWSSYQKECGRSGNEFLFCARQSNLRTSAQRYVLFILSRLDSTDTHVQSQTEQIISTVLLHIHHRPLHVWGPPVQAQRRNPVRLPEISSWFHLLVRPSSEPVQHTKIKTKAIKKCDAQQILNIMNILHVA